MLCYQNLALGLYLQIKMSSKENIYKIEID